MTQPDTNDTSDIVCPTDPAVCPQMTCSALGALLAARRGELDVKLLLYAIQKTYNFELLLHKRFTGTLLSTHYCTLSVLLVM